MSTQAPARRPTPYMWRMQTGESLAVTAMRSTHLFYAVRMIFNHTAPAVYQIPGCQRYDGPERWPMQRKRAAVKAMLEELAGRDPNTLTHWMWMQLDMMRAACLQADYLSYEPTPQLNQPKKDTQA